MSLFLSRIRLNPLSSVALRLAADPYELHRCLLGTLPCHNEKPPVGNQLKTAELLFRVDSTEYGPVVLMQSGSEPAWERLELDHRAVRDRATKLFAPTFDVAQRLNFRLLCQPSIRKSGQFGLKPSGKRMPGPRRACRTDEDRLGWLCRKSRDCGFIVETVGLTLADWSNSKRRQAPGGEFVESYDQAQGRSRAASRDDRLGGVRFDGVVVVTDPNRLHLALSKGIGPGKAFGFGLLSVARVT
jgi:CRISPR system Cascade subunit CasE